MALDVMTKPHQLIASDRVEGTAVRRPNGERIGHIERLMIDKITGKVSYAVLSFGGFLGMGANLLPLPWAAALQSQIRGLRTRHRRRGTGRAPSFRADKDFDWGDRSQEAELHRYYGIPPYLGRLLDRIALPRACERRANCSMEPVDNALHAHLKLQCDPERRTR